MSIPTGGAAAEHLADLPAGRGGVLPEQGTVQRNTLMLTMIP